MSCVEFCWGLRVLFLALWVWRILSCFTIFGRHQEMLDGGWRLLDPFKQHPPAVVKLNRRLISDQLQ